MLTFFSKLYYFFLLQGFKYFPRYFVYLLCGKFVYVSKFPVFMGFTDPNGWYFVESFIYSQSGHLEIALEISPGSFEYYLMSDIQIDSVVSIIDISFSHLPSTLPL